MSLPQNVKKNLTLLVIRLLDEAIVLPVTIIGLLAYNWRVFLIVWFYF